VSMPHKNEGSFPYRAVPVYLPDYRRARLTRRKQTRMSVRNTTRVIQSAASTPRCVSVVSVNVVANPPPPVLGRRFGIMTVAVAICVGAAVEMAVALAVAIAVGTAVETAGTLVGVCVAATAAVGVGMLPTMTGVLSATPTGPMGA